MKALSLRWAVLIAFLSLIASCGGGGGSSGGTGAETYFASITVAGAGSTLYTETTNTNAQAGYSPYLVVSSSTPSIGTYLYSLDWNGSSYDTRFEIHVWGSGPGTYDIKNNNFVIFDPTGSSAYSAMGSLSNTSGTITFTEFGAPGAKVKGTFDVISLITSSPTQTAHLTGSFSITRL
jgi:hypothetical protein